ncbi:MAG: CHAT domain-containing protein [Verrucomicrobiota bacterium]
MALTTRLKGSSLEALAMVLSGLPATLPRDLQELGWLLSPVYLQSDLRELGNAGFVRLRKLRDEPEQPSYRIYWALQALLNTIRSGHLQNLEGDLRSFEQIAAATAQSDLLDVDAIDTLPVGDGEQRATVRASTACVRGIEAAVEGIHEQINIIHEANAFRILMSSIRRLEVVAAEILAESSYSFFPDTPSAHLNRLRVGRSTPDRLQQVSKSLDVLHAHSTFYAPLIARAPRSEYGDDAIIAWQMLWPTVQHSTEAELAIQVAKVKDFLSSLSDQERVNVAYSANCYAKNALIPTSLTISKWAVQAYFDSWNAVAKATSSMAFGMRLMRFASFIPSKFLRRVLERHIVKPVWTDETGVRRFEGLWSHAAMLRREALDHDEYLRIVRQAHWVLRRIAPSSPCCLAMGVRCGAEPLPARHQMLDLPMRLAVQHVREDALEGAQTLAEVALALSWSKRMITDLLRRASMGDQFLFILPLASQTLRVCCFGGSWSCTNLSSTKSDLDSDLVRLREELRLGGDWERTASIISEVLFTGCEVDPAHSLFLMTYGGLESLPFSCLKIGPMALAKMPYLRIANVVGRSGLPSSPTRTGHKAALYAGADLPNTVQECRELPGFASYKGECRILQLLCIDRNLSELHIACHGSADPLHSTGAALAMTDGIFSAADVETLKCCEKKLVYLSACETARGSQVPGEPPFGLADAFLRGSAYAVVASLWPVSDRDSRPFAVRFWQGIRNGMSPQRALVDARMSVHSPQCWAAYDVYV